MSEESRRPSFVALELRRLMQMRKQGDVEGLIRELRNPGVETKVTGTTFTVREHVPARLHRLGATEAIPAMCAVMLEDELPRVRRRAALYLRKMKARSAAPSFIVALGDPESSVRRLAALGLAKVGEASATDALIVTLRDESVWVRQAAAKALGRVGDRTASPALKETARRDSPGHPVFRFRYARAIWRLRIRTAGARD
jgi:hypothetical protein